MAGTVNESQFRPLNYCDRLLLIKDSAMVYSLPLQTSLFKQIFASTNPKGKGKGKQTAAADNSFRNHSLEINWESTVRDFHSFIQAHAAQAGNALVYITLLDNMDSTLIRFSRQYHQGQENIHFD